MNLCRVLGSVVCTEKLPVFDGRKLLVVQPIDEHRRDIGSSFIAADHTSSAGRGDVVLVLGEGNGVRQILEDQTAPIRHLIVGVVDQVSVGT